MKPINKHLLGWSWSSSWSWGWSSSWSWGSSWGTELLVQQLFDTIPHGVDEIPLGATDTDLVGDVIDTADRLGVLTVDATGLQVLGSADCLEFTRRSHVWHLDVNGSTQTSSDVGRAES